MDNYAPDMVIISRCPQITTFTCAVVSARPYCFCKGSFLLVLVWKVEQQFLELKIFEV